MVDVSSSSSSESSANTSPDGSGMKREPSVVIIEQRSQVTNKGQETEDADESVKIIEEKEKFGQDNEAEKEGGEGDRF